MSLSLDSEPDVCPQCGKRLTRTVGPAEETRGTLCILYILEVAVCEPCSYRAVLSKQNVSTMLAQALRRGERPPAVACGARVNERPYIEEVRGE